MFARYDDKGKRIRKRVVVDCSNDEILVEQSHKDEVDINKIIQRHGVDMIQKTALLRSQEYQFDDVTGNDFQEAMLKVTKAQQTFDGLPSEIRKKFDNNPAKFMDFVHDSANIDQMVEMGIAERPPEIQPVQVNVVNQEPVVPETNPETPPV